MATLIELPGHDSSEGRGASDMALDHGTATLPTWHLGPDAAEVPNAMWGHRKGGQAVSDMRRPIGWLWHAGAII